MRFRGRDWRPEFRHGIPVGRAHPTGRRVLSSARRPMGKTLIKIGPADHGRPMSLAEFEHAKVEEGYLYELSRGIITVSDVPNRRHALQLIAIRRQLGTYDVLHPGRIACILGGAECKLLIGD